MTQTATRRAFRGLRPAILALFVVILGALTPVPARADINGHWIWSSSERNPANAYSYFRRAFSLDAAPSAATIRVTADTRYVLYVNGNRVGRGPARSHTRHLAYDTWDIRAHLRPGPNVLAALVHHVGESTFRNQIGRAGYLCHAAITVNGQTVSIPSNASWKALASPAWDRGQRRMNVALGFAESFDARLAPQGWEAVSFNDASWPAATVLGPAGMEPWTDLAATTIPPNRETTVRPTALVGALEVESPPDAARLPFGRLYTQAAWAVGYAGTYLHAPRDMTVTLQAGGDDGLRLWVNGAIVLERASPRPGYPAQDSVAVPLKAGWNRVLLKSVKLIGPWNAFLAAAGPGAAEVVVSADRNTAERDTWRISPEHPFDGAKGIALGMQTVFPSETAAEFTGWTKITASVRLMDETAPLMRFESRRPAAPARVAGAGSLLNPGGAATFQSSGRLDGAVVLDMGRPVLGYPTITVRGAMGGEIVDVGYAEALEDAAGRPVPPIGGATGVVNPARGEVNYADRFICRPGINVFEPFDKRGFRYMQIDLRTAGAALTLDAPTVTEALYPVEERGSFSSSDDRLNRIWEAGRATLRLNMDDAYTDCIWRERTQWMGDLRVEALANYYAFGDTALARRGLKLAAQAQDDEGIVRGLFPTDWNGARLPSYSLLWVLSLWEYYLHTGDATLFPEALPAIHRLMDYFETRINPAIGLLDDVPYWVFIDWASGMDGQRTGASASLNAFYYRALLAASHIAGATGDAARADAYTAGAAAVKTAFQRFWDPDTGLYHDILIAGVPSGRFTEQANSLAVAYGLAPAGQASAILQRIPTVPGVLKTGTPYFGSYVLDAMYAAGRDTDAARYMRDQWGPMLDWGSPTLWEKWGPTDSLTHGWAAGPTAHLPARVLGVRPLAPGWTEWTMAPALSGLKWARGRVPTPHGEIEAYWTLRPNGLHVELTVPEETTARVRLPMAGLDGARWLVMQGTRAAAGVERGTEGGHWTARLTRPGRYTIIASWPSLPAPNTPTTAVSPKARE